MRYPNNKIVLACCLALPLTWAAHGAFAQMPPDGGPGGTGMGHHGPGPGGPEGHGPGGPGGEGRGPHGHGEHGGPGGGGPLGELAKAEMDHVAVQVIVDLSKAPAGDVEKSVRAFGVPTALRYYGVDPKAFMDAGKPRLVAIVKAAVQANLVTSVEGDRIVDRMQHEPHDAPPPPRDDR